MITLGHTESGAYSQACTIAAAGFVHAKGVGPLFQARM